VIIQVVKPSSSEGNYHRSEKRVISIFINILKMEVISFFETFVTTYKTACRYYPDDDIRHLHNCEKFELQRKYLVYDKYR